MVKMERVIVENIIINSEIPYGYVTTFLLIEQNNIYTINEQIQNIAQKKDTLCRRMYN